MRYLIFTVAVFAVAAPAIAQQGIGAQIQAVFDRTKTAKSEAELTSIVRDCESLRAQAKNADRVKYLTQLLAWAFNKRGELYAEQAVNSEDFEHAAELDERALKDFESAVSNDPTRWKALHNRGVSYALLGRHEDAETDFSAAVKHNPKYANSWFNRAEIRFENGRYKEALHDYGQTLVLSPKDAGALRGKGACRMKLGDAQQAVADFTAAIQVERSDDLLVQRGLAHQALRQWQQAAGDFRQAIAHQPNSALGYRAAAWLMAVCPDERVRNQTLAVEAAEQAAKLETQQSGQISAPTYDTLGAAYASSGNPTKAAQYAQEALQRANQLSKDDQAAIQRRLQLYKQGKPFRVASNATPAN